MVPPRVPTPTPTTPGFPGYFTGNPLKYSNAPGIGTPIPGISYPSGVAQAPPRPAFDPSSVPFNPALAYQSPQDPNRTIFQPGFLPNDYSLPAGERGQYGGYYHAPRYGKATNYPFRFQATPLTQQQLETGELYTDEQGRRHGISGLLNAILQLMGQPVSFRQTPPDPMQTIMRYAHPQSLLDARLNPPFGGGTGTEGYLRSRGPG